MRQRSLLWVVVGFILAMSGISWYIGRVNSSHPALWPMAGGDPGHRAYSAEPFPATAETLWKLPLGMIRSTSNLVVWEDGTVYLAADTKVMAVGSDGKRQWAWEAGDQVHSLALGRHGDLYALTSTTLFALNPDGTQRWQLEVDLGTGRQGFPLKVGQGGVIYALGPKMLYAVDSTGRVNWRFKGDRITAGVAESDSGKLFLMVGDELYCLSHTGDTEWHNTVGAPTQREAAVVVSEEGFVYVHDRTLEVRAVTGQQQWRRPWTQNRTWNLAVGDGFVQQGLVRLDPRVQAEIWSAKPESGTAPTTYVLVDRDGSTLVLEQQYTHQGSGESTLYLLDNQGQKRWEYKDADPAGLVVPGRGRIYFVGVENGQMGASLYSVGAP
jgi:outer membrane protein assembly factor BamB